VNEELLFRSKLNSRYPSPPYQSNQTPFPPPHKKEVAPSLVKPVCPCSHNRPILISAFSFVTKLATASGMPYLFFSYPFFKSHELYEYFPNQFAPH
jgi:hypothetical protein